MKKSSKMISLLLSLLMLCLLLSGCGSGKVSDYEGGSDRYYDGYEEVPDAASDDLLLYSEKSSDIVSVSTSRRIVESFDFTIQTKSFDELTDGIEAEINKLGGYIESSQTNGSSYFGNEDRYTSLTVRIPKDKQAEFSSYLEENGNVVSKSVTADDITDSYIDTESRLNALKTEKETLEKLLEQSESLTDTLQIYDKLTEVIAELESCQSKLNQMDNKIDYNTYNIYIYEVERETVVEKQSWIERTWTDFKDNLINVGEGISDFFSFVLSSIPYLVLLAILAFVIIIVLRSLIKKKGKKKNKAINPNYAEKADEK